VPNVLKNAISIDWDTGDRMSYETGFLILRRYGCRFIKWAAVPESLSLLFTRLKYVAVSGWRSMPILQSYAEKHTFIS